MSDTIIIKYLRSVTCVFGIVLAVIVFGAIAYVIITDYCI